MKDFKIENTWYFTRKKMYVAEMKFMNTLEEQFKPLFEPILKLLNKMLTK